MAHVPHSFSDLEALYEESETLDKAIFAEMRSNLLLIDGDHYSRRQSDFYRRIRSSKELTDQQKIRLTKNHTQKITDIYSNNIISAVPGVAILPANETELRDQKVAEQHDKLWSYAKEKHDIESMIEDWADDFVGIGEVATKIFWDVTEGKLQAYKQELDQATKEPIFNEDGTPAAGDPIYQGNMVFESVYGFNLFRTPGAQDIRKSPMLGIKKMVGKKKLVAQFPSKENDIVESYDETMVVFDAEKNTFRRTKEEVFLREYYFRPCFQYPKGYFFFVTKKGVLAEGPLPDGIFPIVIEVYRKAQTSARGRSPVRTIRPYQAEINRTASKIAEHQMALGDDKIITQSGTKISQGASLSGIRHLTTTGTDPTILAGRDGSQYVAHMEGTIAELYMVMGAKEEIDDVQLTGQVEPYALLFRSARQKKKFARPVGRFERFLRNVALTYIKLAKHHMPDDMVAEILGRDEIPNIEEFRNASDISYQIKIVPRAEDIDTTFGKQLVLNQTLQYVGSQLSPGDIGSILEAMPFGNTKAVTSDLTINKRSATNDILALDRGKRPLIHEYDDHPYMIGRLVSRMREPDFDLLPDEIKQNYAENVQMREQIEAEKIAKIQAMKDEMIPTGGYLVVVDLYVSDPKDPTKTKRARVPYDSVKWLIDKLDVQGKTLDQLEMMNEGALSEMAAMIQAKNMQGEPVSPPQGEMNVPVSNESSAVPFA